LRELHPESHEQEPFQSVQRFLRLLDDINQMHEELLDETERLRARVRELEARSGPSWAPRGDEGGLP
jgi:hypothetical protein